MPAVQIATPFNLSLEFETPAFHQRLLAYLIDLFIMVLYAWIMSSLVYSIPLQQSTRAVQGWSVILVSLPVLLYPLMSEVTLHGQTIGKKVLGIRVMNLQGGEPVLSQYITRWIFRVFEWPLVFGLMFPGFLIIYQLLGMVIPGLAVLITIVVSAKHQRLGDLAAGTVLVKTRINTSINDTIFQDIDHLDYEPMFTQVMTLSDRDINTIKSVIGGSHTKTGYGLACRTADRIKTALKIESSMDTVPFLEKLLQDYNYLATLQEQKDSRIN